jgi:hypothetical protein
VSESESEEFWLKCTTLFAHVSIYLITKDDKYFNYCTGKNRDCLDTLLVRPETEGEMEETSKDGIECSIPEQCERMCRLMRK